MHLYGLPNVGEGTANERKKNIPEKKSGCADQNDPPHVAVIRGSKDMLLLAGEVGKSRCPLLIGGNCSALTEKRQLRHRNVPPSR